MYKRYYLSRTQYEGNKVVTCTEWTDYLPDALGAASIYMGCRDIVAIVICDTTIEGPDYFILKWSRD